MLQMQYTSLLFSTISSCPVSFVIPPPLETSGQLSYGGGTQVNPAIRRELETLQKVRGVDIGMQSTQELSVLSLQLPLTMMERLSSSQETTEEEVSDICMTLIALLP